MEEAKVKEFIDKGTVNIHGHIYEIETTDQGTCLTPRTTGNDAYSSIEVSDYAYSHGGKIYRLAVNIAREIEAFRLKKRAKDSDI